MIGTGSTEEHVVIKTFRVTLVGPALDKYSEGAFSPLILCSSDRSFLHHSHVWTAGGRSSRQQR